MIWYLGDIHGSPRYLSDMVQSAESHSRTHTDKDMPASAIIQVGDFGAFWPNNGTKAMDDFIHKRARQKKWTVPIITCGGNHDNWDFFLKLEEDNDQDLIEMIPGSGVFYARRGSVIEIGGIKHGFLGGARSTDKHHRTEGVSWWDREEPNRQEMYDFYDNLITHRPDTIVTHDVPSVVPMKRQGRNTDNTVRSLDNLTSATKQDGYKPRRWYFGHHHVLDKWKINGTKYFGCGLHGQYWSREK